ncbi:PLP-dependent aminotransferase family protein [Stenotrophomonas maltophilia]|uniref:MocR-like pyridoxine biosynthesis transcription factor PdxR n=1 Tax=Stenotrophomonas maltophilia TaxID=40324 RepID=UPI0032010D23|nr:PLP-dependent aminotransferase family protein [Stenotrophomonas maltophilia]
MDHATLKPFGFDLDRAAKTPLSEQIRQGIADAIRRGVLQPGDRLPSWQDLASQLGVARGTVQVAYEKLNAEQLVVASQSSGTRVARRLDRIDPDKALWPSGAFFETYVEMTRGPAAFQMGVPSRDVYPAKLLSRIHNRAVRRENSSPLLYPDPRGEPELRREIAAYLAVARGIQCSPSQVLITSGFSAGLGLAINVLGLAGQSAWVENPGFPWTRHALQLSNIKICPVPVDKDGARIDLGINMFPNAKAAILTPGQQAPLGYPLSIERRKSLIEFAKERDVWVLEDDYLGELQLEGRTPPALASIDNHGRVVHLGTFSKTLSPTLRLGFLVAPAGLTERFIEFAACLAPPPSAALQLAIAEFMHEGHYLRHLRRIRRTYGARRTALLECLRSTFDPSTVTAAGLAVLLALPDQLHDVSVAERARAFGMAPSPLSRWCAEGTEPKNALILSSATTPTTDLASYCTRLHRIIQGT